jgi:hypothetical protein
MKLLGSGYFLRDPGLRIRNSESWIRIREANYRMSAGCNLVIWGNK